jgi:hypothetical protein
LNCLLNFSSTRVVKSCTRSENRSMKASPLRLNHELES